jgi:hypothetical protein
LAAETTGITSACLLLTGRAAPATPPTPALAESADVGTLSRPATEFREVLDLVSDLRR